MKKIISILIGLSVCLNLHTQTLQKEQFQKEIFIENFNSSNSTFSSLVNSENYIVIDNGDLFMNRINTLTHHIIFSKNIIKLEEYRIKIAIKNGPSTKRNSYAGIVMNTPVDSSERIGVKINGKQEYRIRKITTSSKFLEKQKNKQLQNEILSLYSEEEASENSKDVVYRVQLGIFDELIDVEGIENLTTIHTQAQQVINIAGKFDNFSSAIGYLLEMSKIGFEDAFIIKF